MSYELAKATDVVSGGLQAQTGAAESGRAIGFFTAECHDKDGNLKWKAEAQNLVVAYRGSNLRASLWLALRVAELLV